MEKEKVRKATLELNYREQALGDFCVGARFIDYAQGSLDSLEVYLEDREARWRKDLYPQKTDTIHAKYTVEDWYSQGARQVLDCGVMEVDEVVFAGPPDKVTIKAHAAKVKRNARTEQKKTAWDEVDLKTIAGDIAGRAGLISLEWAGENRHYERVEQKEEGDLNFLRRLCRDAGNKIRVVDNKLIVFSGSSWDSRPPVFTLNYEQDDNTRPYVLRYRSMTKGHDVYRGCVVKWWNPKKKEMIAGSCFAPQAPTGEVLQVNNREVKTIGEAEQLAKSRLRRKNREEVPFFFELMGDVDIKAAMNCQVNGFGRLDGRYFADQAEHLLDARSGYTVQLQTRKVLAY